LGYRFFPLFAVAAIRALAWLRVDPIHLPTLIAIGLVLINGALLVAAARPWLASDRLDASSLLLMLPLTSIYASAFYLGLVNYFPAIGFLLLAISCAERWYDTGTRTALAGAAVSLALVYVSHPFAFAFWVVWGACRLGVQALTGAAVRRARAAALFAITLPVIIYHLAAVPKTLGMEASLAQLVPPWPHWLKYRALAFVNGEMFGLDYSVSGNLYAATALALIAACLVHAVAARSFRTPAAQLLLAALLFYFVAGAPEEGALPKPASVALEYDTRFASTAPPVLMMACCIYAWSAAAASAAWRRTFSILGAIALAACVAHLVQVRGWMERFDAFAQANLPAIARGSEVLSGTFPSKYNADGSYIRHYRCLYIADCVPSDSWFLDNNELGLFPVKLLRRAAERN
jgi:hypothetical protein